MDYDVLILGGGIIGCAVAYELSKYNLNIAVIEKDYDVADDISFANTAVIYDGSETKDDLMSSLEHMGNSILAEITRKFNVPFKRIGSLRIADTDECVEIIEDMYKTAKSRGIDNIYLIDDQGVYDIEPNLRVGFKKALYSENTAVICPYDLAIAYAEVAFDNGVNFRLEEVVQDIQKMARGFKVTTNKNKFTCKVVINTIPGDNYTIDLNRTVINDSEGKMHYLVLDETFEHNLSNLVMKINSEDKFTFQTPTLSGSTLVGINSERLLDFDEILREAAEILPSVTKDNVNSIFYEDYRKDVMFIDDDQLMKGYIKVTGDHYAHITIAPSIAKMICETIVDNLNSTLKRNFVDKRREFYRFRDMSKEQRNEIISLDKRYGKIVCLCNQVSEGEIIDSIRRPLGARTVEGVKRRTGATFGNCQGAYCIDKIIDIIARETDKKLTEIVEDSKNSKVLVSRIKEFEGI
ncbi:NAD(P)/FAD-dependent oxidoreductase [Clostridium folliculivorans]|uniref:FAD/NAD(P)-binding oxidoreductase n=1 Tax=Clostridium folliculivorans TaxID=2886038 RepID=A0A9W6DD30_9CLOT|nr:FAD-dependent oxidoreductase [Clostridium folliculivorans]GKU27288.1 FAD/NAD(P)-binding oxidoreductase [Clostridium folliculivorans]GKU32139.1 FAD/NAD(P)-binding oxidoreductase [Clostridium folliculivorans]